MFDKANRLFPDNKLILYGHSMGGNLVLNHVISRNRPVDAVDCDLAMAEIIQGTFICCMVLASLARNFYPRLTIPYPDQAGTDFTRPGNCKPLCHGSTGS